MAKVYYYGKYRAKVQKVDDPEKRGRIRVLCPKVLGEAVSNWCEPCIPVAYDYGGDFAVPKVGETVWVEFEEGDANKPIYVGGWWKTNCSPPDPYGVAIRYITWNGCKIRMWGKDTKTGAKETIELEAGGSTATLTEGQIELKVGDSKLTLTLENIKLLASRIDLN